MKNTKAVTRFTQIVSSLAVLLLSGTAQAQTNNSNDRNA